MRKPVVGVMGASANDALTRDEERRVRQLAAELGTALAKHECMLLTGATTGLPDMVARAFRARGGFALGVSPAENRIDHREQYGLPEEGADVLIFTGFGYKGRNVINIRSSDIVLIFGGAIGTLNEFTIAYDEGKIIGVLQGSGGIADHVDAIIDICNKPTSGAVLFDSDCEQLVVRCLETFHGKAD